MFCPNCGSEEKQNTQYCRACGTDLNVIRTVVAEPDRVTDSAVLARTEVGKAIAKRIETLGSAKDLAEVAEEVLPEVEKFLESPEERRLRRIRTGSLVAFIGLGVAIGFTIASLVADEDVIVLAAMGFVTFFIGLALTINGYLFTIPKSSPSEIGESATPQPRSAIPRRDTNDLLMPASARTEFSSVTENTTRTLDEKIRQPRETDEIKP